MSDTICSYPGDRDEALVTYLYDGESDAASRALFEAHLAICIRCAEDLEAIRGVRTELARWSPPEPRFAVLDPRSNPQSNPYSDLQSNPQSAIRNPQWWRAIPAWAQVAAALVFLGVAAGLANLDVRYDSNGLSVRTGWLPPRDARVGDVRIAPPTTTAGTASQINAVPPWRDELAALERRLKTEFHGAQVGPMTASAGLPPRVASDAEMVRRVRTLIDESEKRQQSELALRLAEALRDVNAQRQADLVRVDRALGTVENKLGVQVLRNQQQMNYYIRTSQRQ